MGKDWRIPPISVWREIYRVLKPGGHVLSFGGTRTFDLIAIGLRAAGFQFRDTIGAEGVPAVSALVAMVLLVLLVLALGLLASRARRTARVRAATGDVIATGPVGSAQLRARAEQLLADGETAEALVEAFRALARRQVEQGALSDDPGATAREVVADLTGGPSGTGPGTAATGRLTRAAELFDAVLYGGLPATAEQARDVLALDDELGGVRR